MDVLELFVELLKYVLPAGLVLLAMRWMQQNQWNEKKMDAQMSWQGKIRQEQSGLVFHAYERALLFLARLEPDQLLARVSGGNLPATQFARALEQNIREEYEHNLAQQLYILPASWEQVLRTQVAVRSMILHCVKSLPEGASGQDLERAIWEAWTQQEQPVTLSAMILLKKDVQSMLLGSVGK